MRRIRFDPERLEYPDGWRERAELLLKSLNEATDAAARARIIHDNPIWTDLRPLLRRLSNGKCWYTEAKQEGTDVDVDHFRPKKRVAELADAASSHFGYWWLAYDPSNYRYSCIVANRRRHDVEFGRTGGKADHFPIFQETERAREPDADHSSERPLLIDPCVAGEPELITFKEDGEAMPRFADTTGNSYKYRKAEKSIELYSINHSEFVKARLDLRDEIEKLRQDALRYFKKIETGDSDHEAGYSRAIEQLDLLRAEDQPYSAFCSAMINRFRHEEYLYGLFLG